MVLQGAHAIGETLEWVDSDDVLVVVALSEYALACELVAFA